MKDREEIIMNYLDGYNSFDIDKMVKDLDDHLLFENISKGIVTDSLNGKEAFKEQAEQAKSFFSDRNQKVTSITHFKDYSEVSIDYVATLAIDFPNGPNKGDKINLQGKSIFEFNKKGKLITIKDIS